MEKVDAKLVLEREAEKVYVSKESMWVKVGHGSPPTIATGLTKEAAESLGGQVEFVRVLPRGRLVNREYPFSSVEHGMRIMLLRSPVSDPY